MKPSKDVAKEVVMVRKRVGDVEGKIVRKFYPGGRFFSNVFLYRRTEGRSLGVHDLPRIAHVALKLWIWAWIRRLL